MKSIKSVKKMSEEWGKGKMESKLERKAELVEEIEALESEKVSLSKEIIELRELVELEIKAKALRAEVAKLREELKALREKLAEFGVRVAPEEEKVWYKPPYR